MTISFCAIILPHAASRMESSTYHPIDLHTERTGMNESMLTWCVCVCVCVCVWLRLTACWHESTVAARGLFHGTVILRVENLPPYSALKLSFGLTRHHPTKTQENSKLYVSPQVEIVLKGEFCFMASHHQLHKVAYFLCPSYLTSLLCQKFKKTDFH